MNSAPKAVVRGAQSQHARSLTKAAPPVKPGAAVPSEQFHPARTVTVHEHADGLRVDNFLMRELKTVPKTHAYRMLRQGEVRVNGGRVKPDHRLNLGDVVRIPPLFLGAQPPEPVKRAAPVLHLPELLHDDYLIALDKPAGLAVHGGSGLAFGAIERLRQTYQSAKFLELVHRLDRETSGILLVAKRRSALTDLHQQLREGRTDKRYLALVLGSWPHAQVVLDQPLLKLVTSGQERKVVVSPEGQASRTDVRKLGERRAPDGRSYSLLECRLRTGRTHQIRVHLQAAGHAIAGDDRYGDFELNRRLVSQGLNRMFLHAARLTFRHPMTGEMQQLSSPLPDGLARFWASLSE